MSPENSGRLKMLEYPFMTRSAFSIFSNVFRKLGTTSCARFDSDSISFVKLSMMSMAMTAEMLLPM